MLCSFLALWGVRISSILAPWEAFSMTKGKVKWFNDAKGYGFIRMEGQDKDIFVHYTSLKAEGFRTLNEGEDVEFELVEGPKGLKAENVVRVQA
jgi:CspA family cold shock protein